MKMLGILIAALLITGCTSVRYDTLVGHAMAMCKDLSGSDADKGRGEAWFWFQSERAKASRKLWNDRGLAAIEAKQASSTDVGDLACLDQLHKEASSHELVRD